MQEKDEKGKKSRTDFGAALCRQVLERLGDGYQAELSQVEKNNGVRKEVMYIRKENSECVPCFYLDELYRSYHAGENEIVLAEYLANIVLNECEGVERQTKSFLKKDWIIDRLFLRLIHYERNKENLKDAVYCKFLDLAAVFYVLTEESEDGVKSYRLPKSIWDSLELGTAEEYYTKIVENTKRLFPEVLTYLEEAILSCMEQENEEHCLNSLEQTEQLLSHRLYMLSNQRRINGAAVLLYPGLLEMLAEKFSGNYFIIPSSVHEILLLKETQTEDVQQLNSIVHEVNEQQVAPEEVLSDHVYYYSWEDGRLQCK